MTLIYNKKMILPYLIIIFFVTGDRFLKTLALNGYFDDKINILGSVFQLSFAKNFNIAFSLPFNGIFLNILILFIILALVYNLIYTINKKQPLETFFITTIILGAISNFLDRIKYGYVVDYLDLSYFTVFNIADAMIVLGVIGLGWKMIILDKNQKIV